MNDFKSISLELCFFFNAIVKDDGSDEHIFNILCINLHFISIQFNLKLIQCILIQFRTLDST